MDKYRVWFGFDGEAYVRGHGPDEIWETSTVLAMAEVWCQKENIEDILREYLNKEYAMDIWDIQIVEAAKMTEEDDDDPDQYVDTYREISTRGGHIGKLSISDFARLWNPRAKMERGDLFYLH